MTLAYRDFRILTYERIEESLEFERSFILPEKTHHAAPRIQDDGARNVMLSETKHL